MFHTAIPIELNIMDLAQNHETHTTTEDNPDNYYPVGNYPFGDDQISETTMAILQDLYGSNNSDESYLDLDPISTDNQHYSPYIPINNPTSPYTYTQNKPMAPINNIAQNNPNQSTSEQGDSSSPLNTDKPTTEDVPDTAAEEQEPQSTNPADNNELNATEEAAEDTENNAPAGKIISTRPTLPKAGELIGNKGKDIIDSMYSKNIASSVNKLIHNLSENKEMMHYIITHHHMSENTTKPESSNTTNTPAESTNTPTPAPNTTESNSEGDNAIVAEVDNDTYITFFSIKPYKPK